MRLLCDSMQMYDVHAIKSMFTICSTATEIIYRGGIDGCVSPFGLMSSSAPRQCRIAYEHKQSPKQKQAYRDQHPDQVWNLSICTHVLQEL